MYDSQTIIIMVLSVSLVGLILYFFNTKKGADVSPEKTLDTASKNMQLQAYERLILLVDRIQIPNLVSRLHVQNVSATEMQALLISHTKEEFDYNITQQLYVTPEIWDALKNFKDQNIYIINKVASNLPNTASATDLNRVLLEFLMNDEKGNMASTLSKALSHEAKKLL